MSQAVDLLLDGVDDLIVEGAFDDVMDICKQTLVAARDEANTDVEAASLLGLASAHRYQGKFQEARILAEGALDLARAHDETDRICDAVTEGAYLKLRAYLRGYEARDDFREAMLLAVDIGYIRGAAHALLGLAEASSALGLHPEAARYAQQALTYGRDLTDIGLQCQALYRLGVALMGQHEDDIAEQYLQQALSFSIDHQFALLKLAVLVDFAWFYMRHDDPDRQAYNYLIYVEEEARRLGWAHLIYRTAHAFGIWHQQRAEYDEARDYIGQIVQLAEATSNPIYEAAAYIHLGWLHTDAEEHVLALDYIGRAVSLCRRHMHPELEAIALEWSARAHANLWEYHLALEALRQARDVYRSLEETTAVQRTTTQVLWLLLMRLYDRFLRLVGIRRAETSDEAE